MLCLYCTTLLVLSKSANFPFCLPLDWPPMTDTVAKPVVSVQCFGGHVLGGCCVRWSADNCLAVVTDRCVQLLTPPSEPTPGQHLKYLQSMVANPDKPMTFDCGMTTKQVLDSCQGIDEQQLVMTDPTLAGETVNSVNLKAYRRVEWSPTTPHFGCLLAALTLDHRLAIYVREGNDWKLTIDLSVLLNQKLKDLWTGDKTVDFQTYRTRMYSLATFTFCWAQDWNDNNGSNTCRLFAASKNGLMTLWDITLGSDPSVFQISADMVSKWDTDLDQINCVKCFEDYLIISSIKGTVCVVRSDFTTDSIPNPLFLWSEEDRILVNEFAIKSMDNNVFEVVFAKSDYVIVCRFNAELSSTVTQKVVSGLHQMPSTSICPINDAKYLLSSQDGRLVELDIDDELNVEQIELSFDGLSPKAMSAHGVDSSFNGVLSVVVQSLSQFYDHLLIREPIRVTVFANLSAEELWNLLWQNFLADEESDDRKTSFDEYFDYLCCAQSFLSASSSANSGLSSYLLGLMENQSLITECRHAFKLRIIRFLLKSFIVNLKDLTVKTSLESSVKLCEDTIRKVYFEEVVHRLLADFKTLTESQCQSLKNINSWHLLHFGTPLVLNESLLTAEELCPICDQVIPFESHLFGRCSQSHRFDRCFNTLVLLDFARHKYRKCVRCRRSLIVRSPIWDKCDTCLFCQ